MQGREADPESDRDKIRSRLNESKTTATVYCEDQSKILQTPNSPSEQINNAYGSQALAQGFRILCGVAVGEKQALPRNNRRTQSVVQRRVVVPTKVAPPIDLRPSFKLSLITQCGKLDTERAATREIQARRLSHKVP